MDGPLLNKTATKKVKRKFSAKLMNKIKWKNTITDVHENMGEM